MIRVLQVVNRMGYGGIESFLMNIYRNIDRNKIQFDFAVHTTQKGEYDEEIKNMGGRIYYFRSRHKGILKYYKDWNKFLRENGKEYNAIHMHVSSLTTLLPIKLSKRYKIKNRIIHAHNTFQRGKIHNILNKINRINLNDATQLFACSTEAGNYVFGKNKFKLFHNGIDAEKYQYNETEREKVREKLKIDKDTVALVHVGRFSEAKNHTFLIDVFNEINKIKNNYKLFLIGSGELKDNIIEKVNKLKISDKVIFLNNRNDVFKLLKGMDFFIFPSNFEGLPVAMIEAQASGLKVFASDRISPESKISDLVEFIPLSENAKEWAEIIVKSEKYNRNNMKEIITKEGYNIISLIQTISDTYCN